MLRALTRKTVPAMQKQARAMSISQPGQDAVWKMAYTEIGSGLGAGLVCGAVWWMYSSSNKSSVDDWYATHNSDCSGKK